jgi:hypothetical protein
VLTTYQTNRSGFMSKRGMQDPTVDDSGRRRWLGIVLWSCSWISPRSAGRHVWWGASTYDHVPTRHIGQPREANANLGSPAVDTPGAAHAQPDRASSESRHSAADALRVRSGLRLLGPLWSLLRIVSVRT